MVFLSILIPTFYEYINQITDEIVGLFGFTTTEIIRSGRMRTFYQKNTFEFIVEGREEVDLKSAVNFIYVYSNVGKEQIVGDVTTPLLRAISIPSSENGNQVCLYYDKPFYIPVSRNHIESIEILMCDENGEQIKFGNGRTQVVLHFRST